MTMLLATCCLTTAVAIASTSSAVHALLPRRTLPWAGGVLLGISVFWILPEMAGYRGWLPALAGVSAIVLLLGGVDRFIYPICPFCAAGMHTDEAVGSVEWPLLVVGCLHSFFDGWAIGLSQAAARSNFTVAISWGATIHKVPESVAIGLLAARLTSSRKMALGTVALIQTAMALGGLLAVHAGSLDAFWAEIWTMPSCAILLLFGLLALQQEWRLHGRVSAVRTAAPGLVGCGLVAVATWMLSR